MFRHRFAIALVATSLFVAACSNDSGGTDTTPATEAPTTEPAIDAPVSYPPADFTVQPGVHQVAVLGAEPGTDLTLELSETGESAGTGTVDEQGSFLWRRLEPGLYRVVMADESAASDTFEVHDENWIPEQSFYEDQPLLPAGGFGYVTTRDGTTLSANVMLPGPADQGPYPTVVEYSGYAPSNPDDTTFGQLFNALGYAYVGVNMRGTGCSGGSFRFFEEAQLLDGYDVIEAVAAQDWVFENEVGMVGISYPGISQLFVASTQPPHLEAITPLSVLDDSYRSTLYPGGILNTGFAVDWTKERVEQSKPYGQGWSKTMADGGDTRCADNQLLRLQNPDLLAEIDANPYYSAEVGDEINPSLLVGKINVPVFLAGAWQDEQTGGHFPALLDKFDSAPHLYVNISNGLHTESIGPANFPRMAEFLSLYVKKEVPNLTPLGIVGPILASGIFGTGTMPDITNRFEGKTYEQALAAFEAEPSVRILFEEGAIDGAPGAPLPRWTAEFPSWPIPNTTMSTWMLGADGALAPSLNPTGSTTYTADPDAVPATFYEGSGSGIWKADVTYNWVRNPEGTAAVFTSDPLTDDVVVIGRGFADLWVSTDAPDTDLEVTISEVRPDGSEVYVQSGWLRASHRTVIEGAMSGTGPIHSHLESDASPLTSTDAYPMLVELFPVAHPFRAASRIRVTIDAPGGNRGIWAFRTISNGEKVTIVHNGDTPSSIRLPIVSGLDVPAGVAPCGSLRGQPCRPAGG